MKFFWYNTDIVDFFLKVSHNITADAVGSSAYQSLVRLDKHMTGDNVLGFVHDTTNHVPHHFNIKTQTPYTYSQFFDNFETTSLTVAKKIVNATHKPIAVLWSGGIDSTHVLVSLLRVVSPSRITVVLSEDSVFEYSSFYNDIIQNQLTTISTVEWASAVDNYFTVSGHGGDALWGMLYDDFCVNTVLSDRNRPWQDVFAKNFCADFDFFEEFCTWSGVEIRTYIEFRTWFYLCCKWQDQCNRLYMYSVDLGAHNSCAFYNFDNSFRLWAVHNLDKIIGSAWQDYKVPAKHMIFQYHNDLEYFKNKSKVKSHGLDSTIYQYNSKNKLNNLKRFVIFDDYTTYNLPSWPKLNVEEWKKFNSEHELIPQNVLKEYIL
jgi:hypothetical protein